MIKTTQDYIQATLGFRGEGSITAKQIDYLQKVLLDHPGIKHVVETGFNLGVSASAFLGVDADITVVSFDWLKHPDSLECKNIIDGFFPGRHTLIAGDSLNSLTAFSRLARPPYFDLAFVDGGHVWPVPYQDLVNLLALLKTGGGVVMDDYCPAYGNEGVTRAWDTCVASGKIMSLGDPFTDGNRGMVIGVKL